jgi:hypothetical protein
MITTAILVAALAAFPALLDHVVAEGDRRAIFCVLALIAGLVAVQTGLRFDYVMVVSGAGVVHAALVAGMWCVITCGLAACGYAILRRAEPPQLYAMRVSVGRLAKSADELAAKATRFAERQHHAETALRLLLSRHAAAVPPPDAPVPALPLAKVA